jgi:hypothetical protein
MQISRAGRSLGYKQRSRTPGERLAHSAEKPQGCDLLVLGGIEIGDFLTSGVHGPQHAELLRLIGTLVGLRSDA